MKFSIITTSYNSAKTISKSINSLKKQNFKNIEMLWIDNSSMDGTYQILKKNKTSKTKLIKVKNMSISKAWNLGIKKSKGDIVGFLNSDDALVSKNIIARINDVFSKKKCNVVYTDIFYINYKNKIIRNWISDKFTNKILEKEYFKKKIKYGWMPPHPGFFVSKKFLRKIGYFNNSYKVSFDYDLILRILKSKDLKAYYLPIKSVKMLIGGNSNKISNIITKMKEDIKIINNNNVGGILTLLLKNISKISQFFIRSKN